MKLKFVQVFCLLLVSCIASFSQTAHYNQFWNEFAFTHTFKSKFSTELNLGQSYTSTEGSKNIFYANSQVYLRGWVHYYASARWKLSYAFAYYYNKYVPEIDQREYPEMRTTLQGIYYIHKINYTLLTRFRFEDRHILNNAGYYEGVYRLRSQLKFVYAFNSRIIRQGVIYGLSSDEIFIKSISKVTGASFFDRNRFTIGAGYALTDDTQLEMTFVNEFLPRNPANEMYNALQVNVNFNNLFQNVGKKIFSHKDNQNTPEGNDDN